MATTPEEKRTLTVADLDLVYVRVQEPDGSWDSKNAVEMTDRQFDYWAHSRAVVEDCSHTWPPEERAFFCDMLWQLGELHLLRREALAEEEEAAGDVGLGEGGGPA